MVATELESWSKDFSVWFLKESDNYKGIKKKKKKKAWQNCLWIHFTLLSVDSSSADSISQRLKTLSPQIPESSKKQDLNFSGLETIYLVFTTVLTAVHISVTLC